MFCDKIILMNTQEGSKLFKKMRNWFWKFLYYMNSERILKKYGVNSESISEVYVSYLEPLIILLGLNTKKNNKNLRFYGYEDGSSSYARELDEKKGVMERFFHVPIAVFEKEKYYLYRPEIIKKKSYEDRLAKINNENPKTILLQRKLYGAENIQPIAEKIIFFDSMETDSELDSFLNLVIDIFGVDEILCKKHPRRKNDYFEKKGVHTYAGPNIPFEVYMMSFDLEDKIIISGYSSVCFNVKAIYNQEPIQIFLYNMSDVTSNYLYYQNMIEKIKILYENKSRIYVPENVEDLRVICKSIVRF